MPTRAMFDLGICGFSTTRSILPSSSSSATRNSGVVDPFHPQQGMRLIEDVLDVIFADGVAQHDEYFILTYDTAVRRTAWPMP